MRDHGWVRQRGDGAALGLGHIGVQQGEAAHIDLVDKPAALEPGRLMRHLWQRTCHHGTRDEIGGVLAVDAEARMLDETAVEFARVWIDQQFGGIEPQVGGRVVGAVGAVAVKGAGHVAGQVEHPYLARARHGVAGLGLAREQAQVKRIGARRAHGEAGYAALDIRAQPWRHVTTSGALRPVWAAIPAMASAAAIRSASIAGVSFPSRPSGPS